MIWRLDSLTISSSYRKDKSKLALSLHANNQDWEMAENEFDNKILKNSPDST